MAQVVASFQENIKKLQSLYSTLNEDDLVELQKKIAAEARTTSSIAKSVEEIKELGAVAVNTDSAFVAVSRAFQRFVDENKHRFPETEGFLARWNGYHTTWKRILTESRDFATVTSGQYQRYDQVYLNFVQNLTTAAQIKEAVAALKQFSESSNVAIPIDYANSFKELGDEIKGFREDFASYLEQKGQDLIAEVKRLQGLLDEAEKVVLECNKLIEDAAYYVQFLPFVGFFAKEIVELFSPGTVERRKKAVADANRYKQQIEEANNAQIELAKMQTQFAALDSEFQIIASGLAIFANTWAYFHAEALKFSNMMNNYESVQDFPSIFKSEVDLARAIAKPLQEGLDAYATVIVIPT
jgi:hypothetical protein